MASNYYCDSQSQEAPLPHGLEERDLATVLRDEQASLWLVSGWTVTLGSVVLTMTPAAR